MQCLFLSILAGVLFVALPAHSQLQGENSSVVAEVNGEVISVKELEAVVETELAPLLERIAKLRLSALNKLIDNRLIEQAARRENLSTSVVRHTERALSNAARARLTFSRMSVAFAVQMKGLGFWLC